MFIPILGTYVTRVFYNSNRVKTFHPSHPGKSGSVRPFVYRKRTWCRIGIHKVTNHLVRCIAKRSTLIAKPKTDMSSQELKLGLTTLASELLLLTISFLPRSDIKSLRLTSPKLCDIASPRMFESISVRSRPRSMRQLEEIAKSTIWASQVQYIEWTPPSMIGMLTRRRVKDLSPERILNRLTKDFSQLPSVKIVRYSNVAPEEWTADNPEYGFLALMVRTRLRPARIETDYVTIDIVRDVDSSVMRIDIRGTPSESHPDFQSEKSFRRAPYILERIDEIALLRPRQCTMETVWLDIVSTTKKWKCFLQSPGLQEWKLSNVLLGQRRRRTDRVRPDPDPLRRFLALLKFVGSLAKEKAISMPEVSLKDICQRSYQGCIDASCEEIAR